MIKCVIFDLDGTLLNTLDDLHASVNHALNKFGYPSRTKEDVKNYIGDGVRLLIERAIPEGKYNLHFEDCLTIFKNHYKNNMYNNTAPYPEIIEMLKALKSRNIKTAVVSNKFDLAVKELCEKYFQNLIDIAIGENEHAGIRKKPAPDSILKIQAILNLNREHVIYVGDSITDIQTAKNARINCAACTWGYRDKTDLERGNPKFLIDNPYQILDICFS